MSSECRCHLNDWCFYCEMYVPLERERDKWKAEAKHQLQLFNEEFETARKYMEERDQLRTEHTTMKEALEWIVECGTDYQSINKARSVLSTLTKEESHE